MVYLVRLSTRTSIFTDFPFFNGGADGSNIYSLQKTSALGKRWQTVDKRQTTGQSSSRTRQMYHEHELRTASPRGGWVRVGSDRVAIWGAVGWGPNSSLRFLFPPCSRRALAGKLSSVRPPRISVLQSKKCLNRHWSTKLGFWVHFEFING